MNKNQDGKKKRAETKRDKKKEVKVRDLEVAEGAAEIKGGTGKVINIKAKN